MTHTPTRIGTLPESGPADTRSALVLERFSSFARLEVPRVWKTAGVPAPELETRSATPGDIDAVLAFWEQTGQSNWARWVKPVARQVSGA